MFSRCVGLWAIGFSLAAPLARGAFNANAVFDPGLTGPAKYDGWAEMTSGNYPGYGNFPGATPWPAPIKSNQPGSSGDVDALKVLFNKESGNGFASGASIYAGGFSGSPNAFAGSFALTEANPLSGLKNVVLQIQIGDANGYHFVNHVPPALTYNSGAAAPTAGVLAPRVVHQEQNGFAPAEVGEDVPVYVDTLLFQWDLSSISEPITDFKINWSVVQHTQTYAMRLDQSQAFAAATVPEPAGMALAGMAVLGLVKRRRRG